MSIERRVARRFCAQMMAFRVACRFDVRMARSAPAEDEDESDGKARMPARWPDFLDEVHQGGKQRVPNPNPETRKEYREISYSTALRYRPFFERAVKEYRRWLKSQDREDEKPEKVKKKTKPKEEAGAPIGKPVHKAFTIVKHPETSRLQTALDAIGKVHGDGKLPKIPLQIADYHNHGAYFHGGPKAGAIVTKAGNGHMELNTLHEIGHFLDHQGIFKRGTFASMSDKRLKPLMKAMEESESIKTLRSLSGKDKAKGKDGKSFKISSRQIGYQLRPQEMFARAYAQWVVLRSGDKTLKKQLQVVLDEIEGQKVRRPRQWPEKDFEPIAQEFDKVFRKLGWIK